MADKGKREVIKMREEKIGWKNYIGIVLVCLLVGLMFEGVVSADRGMIPTSDVSVYGPGQKAIIAWNGEEEVLILSTDVYTSENSPVRFLYANREFNAN